MSTENSSIISVVTGGSGFVGSHLVDLLIEKGHKVKCIVRESSDLKWLNDKPVEIIKCGLFDKTALKEVLIDADYLYHVAGVVKSKYEEGYFSGNVETTRTLLETLLELNSKIKRILIVSSQTAAGPSGTEKAITEDVKPSPITTYGRSKLEQEKVALDFSDKLPITIVRASAVYGERDTEIYLIFKTYHQGLMTLVGFNEKKVSLVHVNDLVNGIYLAATNENSKNQIYFISSKEYYTWPQVSGVIAKAMGKKAINLRIPHFLVYIVAAIAQFFALFSKKAATFNLEKARDFVQTYWTCDISKAEKELGYVPKISLEDGLKRTIDWYRKMKWL
ncbi:MAG: NAD(P)-dependent oxidoreductase [Ignavibacteriae bacterium HGW-Ignavibacteriae-2]|jgi:nucleoside-diphosphate-sugar epimerase|nr:MAG: NAD(P)-dependent oxidoreductase [Ignavibacteriae bacterium HGW-Ignavibacteriae-2]